MQFVGHTLVVAAVASIPGEDSLHMGLQVVAGRHCWILRMSGVEEVQAGWGLRQHVRVKGQPLPG